MRILDRYVSGIFLSALAVFTLTFVALFVTVDLAAKVGKFLDLRQHDINVTAFVAQYYAIRLPMILNSLLPASVLFASVFTVVKLARTNEILPIAASGTSLRRMAVPFFAAALAVTLLMASIDEFVLTRLARLITDSDEILSNRGVSYGVEDYDGIVKLTGEKYDLSRREISDVRITRLDREARPIEVVVAKRASWDAGRRRWIAREGTITYPESDPPVQVGGANPPSSRPEVRVDPIASQGYVVEAPFTPESLKKGSSPLNRFVSEPIPQLVRDAREHPREPSRWIKVHTRFAFPLSPLVLLLLGLPSVVAAHSKSFIKGLFFCFLLALSYYLVHFLSLELGYRGSLPPAWAGWTPTGLFGSLGLAAFARMRT
jgi:lipopolysaccharide export system permease protein